MTRAKHPRNPERLFLDDKAYQRFRFTAVTGDSSGYANEEQWRRAAWYSVRPTLEETGWKRPDQQQGRGLAGGAK